MLTARTTTFALQPTIDQINTLNEYLNVQLGPAFGADWIAAADLAADRVWYDTLARRIATVRQVDDRRYVAMTLFGSYLWQPIVASVGCYLAARRVPELRPDRIMLHVDDKGWADRLALRSGRFAALPDDLAATDDLVTVVADREALRAYLIEQITEHYLPPMIDQMRTRSPLGKRALWATVADRIVGSVLWLAKELGIADRCRDEAAALVQSAPLQGKTGVLLVTHNDRTEPFLKRGSCCYSYKLADHGYCSTCPLQPVEERVRRLQDYMAQNAH